VAERQEFTGYGVVTVHNPDWSTDAEGSDFGWVSGHQGTRLEPRTGYLHHRNRDYIATLQRWAQMDPNPADNGGMYVDGLSAYGFVRGGPVEAADARGWATQLSYLVKDRTSPGNLRKIARAVSSAYDTMKAASAAVANPSDATLLRVWRYFFGYDKTGYIVAGPWNRMAPDQCQLLESFDAFPPSLASRPRGELFNPVLRQSVVEMANRVKAALDDLIDELDDPWGYTFGIIPALGPGDTTVAETLTLPIGIDTGTTELAPSFFSPALADAGGDAERYRARIIVHELTHAFLQTADADGETMWRHQFQEDAIYIRGRTPLELPIYENAQGKLTNVGNRFGHADTWAWFVDLWYVKGTTPVIWKYV
jgi:RHS repeat-associated protein